MIGGAANTGRSLLRVVRRLYHAVAQGSPKCDMRRGTPGSTTALLAASPNRGTQQMRPLSLFIVALAGLIAVPALAQTPAPANPPVRIRGTVEKLDGHTLTVKSRDGQSMTVALADNVAVAYLVKASMADIKSGDYLASTGMKGTDG